MIKTANITTGRAGPSLTYRIWDYDGNGSGYVYATLADAMDSIRTHDDPCFIEDSTGKTVYDWDGQGGTKK